MVVPDLNGATHAVEFQKEHLKCLITKGEFSKEDLKKEVDEWLQATSWKPSREAPVEK